MRRCWADVSANVPNLVEVFYGVVGHKMGKQEVPSLEDSNEEDAPKAEPGDVPQNRLKMNNYGCDWSKRPLTSEK